MKKIRSGVFIAPGRKPWPHELRVAEILAIAGHSVEFLNETNLHTADILLDGIEYEIKSPERFNANTMDHMVKSALHQSPNIIIDTSRLKGSHNEKKVLMFLKRRTAAYIGLRRMLFVTKSGKTIDIFDSLR